MTFKKIDHEDNQRPEGKTSILVFGYDPIALNSIKTYAAELAIPEVIEVKNDQTYNTLKQLIDHKGNFSAKPLAYSAPAIVLNAVSSAELNQFVHNFKTLGLPKCLFAVVTPTSINWKFHDLIEDLLEERAMFEKMHAEKMKAAAEALNPEG